jgi:signal transduction histidine kinase/ActR/RegA family two-component response regulator
LAGTPPPDAPPGPSEVEPSVAWRRVVRASSPEEVLSAVASAAGCDLRIVDGDETSRTADGATATFDRFRVCAFGGPGDEGRLRAAARAGAEALAVWEAARDEVRRANLRAAEHGRDVEALQALGQELAAARDASELLAAVSQTLHARVGLDACGLVERPFAREPSRWIVFRPGMGDAIRSIAARAHGVPEGTAEKDPRISVVLAPGFDPGLPPRVGGIERDTLLVPIGLQDAARVVLAAVLTAEPDRRARRIVQGVAGLLALHLDRMEASAREDDVRFRAIVDGMPQAVWLLDPEARVVRCNRAAEALGPTLAPLPLEPFRALGNFDVSAAVTSVLRGGPPATDSDVRFPGGRVFSVTLSPVRDAAENPVGAVLVAEDVTEARRLQSRVAQSERLSSLGRMLSGVAHELNNPLATVIGFAEIARASPDHPSLEKRLRLIHEEADRCRRIVGNLLRFARRQEPERKSVVLNEIVEATLGLLAYPLRVDGIRVETDLDRSLPAIHADPHEIQQVLVNLVTNAHQAIRSTGGSGVVSVRTARKGDAAVVVEVRDDGPGIPDDLRDRIFDPFFTTKPPGEGTGLGLSPVYGTVRSHGGSVEVDSAPGCGATFVVTLPTGVRAASAADPRPRTTPDVSLRGCRVLVVDDEPGICLLVREALEREGAEVCAANDAAAVRTLLREEPFDLIVCDLHMAGLGAERLHRLLLGVRPDLARGIVLTTGDSVSPEPERVAKAIGAVLVHKPFDLPALLAAVRTSLARRRAS